jgi:hypothetical protein
VSAAPLVSDVLITRSRAKLPPAIAALLDRSQPLPPGVRLFEKQVTVRELLNPINGAIAFGVVGVLCFVWGTYLVADSTMNPPVGRDAATLIAFGAALACAGGTVGMLASFAKRLSRRSDQRAGRSTRFGIFLAPAAIIAASPGKTVVIPRSRYRGTNGPFLGYESNGRIKYFELPDAILPAEGDTFATSLHFWTTGVAAPAL